MSKSEKQQKQPNQLALIFLIIQTIFIIAMAAFIPTLIQDGRIKSDGHDKQPKITIEGFNAVSPKPLDSSISDIERKLFTAVQKNTNDIDLSTTTATIRENSIKTLSDFDGNGINYLSAIIDVPTISQSYRLFFEYNSEDQTWSPRPPYTLFLITCLNQLDQIIYPDFTCHDTSGPEIYNGIIARYINRLNNDKFSMFVSDSDINILYVNPLDSDYESHQQDYIKQAENAVESLGVPSEIFTYRFPSYSNLIH